MPIYDFACSGCGKLVEAYVKTMFDDGPKCCGGVMTRQFSSGQVIKSGYPLWVDRMDDIHKAQQQRGERLRMVHPKEIGAT